MATVKRTYLEQIKLNTANVSHVRFALDTIVDGVLTTRTWHRMAMSAGTNVAAAIALINTDIAARSALLAGAVETDLIPIITGFCAESALTYPGYNTTTSRTAVLPALVAGQTTKVILAIGQSNIASTVNAVYSPTHAAMIQNLNILDGRLYQWAEPMLGASQHSGGGAWLGRFGDKKINAGFCARLIIIPIASDNTTVAQWNDGNMAWRITQALALVTKLGLTLSHILWMQGEADKVAGTTANAYTSALQAIVTTIRNAGFTCPFVVSQTSWISGATGSAVRTGQANAVSAPLNIVLGPDTDTLDGSKRHDNTHFNATGADECATLWAAAIS